MENKKYNILVNFEGNDSITSDPITIVKGDYNSVDFEFQINKTYNVALFFLIKPNGKEYVTAISGNKLTIDDTEIFDVAGEYQFGVSIFDEDSKLTNSSKGKIIVVDSGLSANSEEIESESNYQILDDLIKQVQTLLPTYNENAKTKLNDFNDNYEEKLNEFLNKTHERPFFCENIETMKNNNVKSGSFVRTLGYYSANDGGGADYLIRDKNDDEVEDGGSIHFLENGLVAELICEKNVVNVKQFGAYGNDNNDDTTMIQNAINKFNNILISAGTYKITNTLNLKSNQTLKGFSNSILKYYGDGTYETTILKIEASDNTSPIDDVLIDTINIECSNQKFKGGASSETPILTSPNAYNKGLIGVSIKYGRNIRVLNSNINELYGSGIIVKYSNNIKIDNNNLYNVSGSNALSEDSFGDGICFFSSFNCQAKNNTIINKRTYLTHDLNYQNIDVFGKICGRSGLEFEYKLDKLFGGSDSKYYCVDYDLSNDRKQTGCIFENNYIYGYSKGIHLEEDVKSIIKNNTLVHNHIGVLNTSGCDGTVIDGNYFDNDNVGPSPQGNYDMNYCGLFLGDAMAHNRVFGKFATNNKFFGDGKGICVNGGEFIISNNEFKCKGSPISSSSQENMNDETYGYKLEKGVINSNYFEIYKDGNPIKLNYCYYINFEGNIFNGENNDNESGYATAVSLKNQSIRCSFNNNIFKCVLIDLVGNDNNFNHYLKFKDNKFIECHIEGYKCLGLIFESNEFENKDTIYQNVINFAAGYLQGLRMINNLFYTTGDNYNRCVNVSEATTYIYLEGNKINSSLEKLRFFMCNWNVSDHIVVKNNIYKLGKTIAYLGIEGSTISCDLEVIRDNLGEVYKTGVLVEEV